MSQHAGEKPRRVLDRIDRISEILFGLIMVLTFTGSLSAAESGRAEVRELLLGALTCNLAWGLIDGVFYLMGSLADSAHRHHAFQSIRLAPDVETARSSFAEVVPQKVVELMEPAHFEALWQKVRALPEPPKHARLGGRDYLGALGVFLLVMTSMFPIALPFLLMEEAMPALRVSNGIALVMMFLLGAELGRCTGRRPWAMGLTMVIVGSALVSITIALGG